MPSPSNAVKTLRRFYKNKSRSPAEIAKDLAGELVGTSDRGAVIILAAFIHDALSGFLAEGLIPLSDDEREYAFRSDGPLGSFSSRIDMAYLFGGLSKDTRDRLHDLRELRNACAHTTIPISFKNAELRNVARRITRHPINDDVDESDTRQSLIQAVMAYYMELSLGHEGALKLLKDVRDGKFSPAPSPRRRSRQ